MLPVVLSVAAMSLPIHAQVNASTPQAAAKGLVTAMQSGKADDIRHLFIAETEPQRELAAAFADLILAGRRLEEAALEQFGPEGQPLVSQSLPHPMLGRIDNAKIEQTGDEALLHLPDQPRPMRLRKVGGEWKVDLLTYAGGSEQALPDQVALLKAMAEALDESAVEVKEGRHPTPPEAQEAVATRLRLIMLQSFAASQPATHPAIQPTKQPPVDSDE